jgi:nitrite reductase/ring-hydroxylating ferredoxin subunit
MDMAFVKVYSVAKLPPDSVAEVLIDGYPIALCNFAGWIRAIEGICPHQGGPLGQGAMNGENVVCPWHAWEFSCKTGENDFDPDTRVRTICVRVEGDDILVDSNA